MFSFPNIIVKLWSFFCTPQAHGFLYYWSCFCTELNGIIVKFPITLFTLLVAEDVIALRGNFHRNVYFVAVSDNSVATSKVWN